MSEQWCWKLKISGDARGSGRTVFLLDDGSAVDVAHDIEVDSSDREVVAVTRFPESKRPLPIFGNTDPVYIGESWDIEEPAVAAVKKAYACIASAVAAYELGGAVTFGRGDVWSRTVRPFPVSQSLLADFECGTRSCDLSGLFAEQWSGPGQADAVENPTDRVECLIFTHAEPKLGQCRLRSASRGTRRLHFAYSG